MKIGVISDTHIPSMGPAPPDQVIKAFEGVDLIVHAGDIYADSALEWLGRIAPVESAKSRFAAVAEGAPRTGTTLVLELEGRKVGVVHKLELLPIVDEIYPGSLSKYPDDQDLTDELVAIFGEPVDIVIFGYTHEAMVETFRDVLFVNPGSTSMIKQSMLLGHVAVLDLNDDGSAEAEVIYLGDIEE